MSVGLCVEPSIPCFKVKFHPTKRPNCDKYHKIISFEKSQAVLSNLNQWANADHPDTATQCQNTPS